MRINAFERDAPKAARAPQLYVKAVELINFEINKSVLKKINFTE